MKKVALLLITMLVVCGCEKKNENDVLFPSNVLKIKGSDVCMFDDLSSGDGVVVKSYCADSILLTDSNLDMLRIHEEESMMNITKERIIEQFGYFNTELLVLERKFHNRFCPDKELSIWSMTKNVKK